VNVAKVGVGQARDMPLDSHLHTDLSPDSDVPIDIYAAQAVERGIAEIAVTDHIDFDPRVPSFSYAPFELRERVAREAAGRWGDRVAIRFGVEVTYERRYEGQIRDHLAAHAYDYTIGSVHVGPDSPYRGDRVTGFATGKSIAEAVAPYFAEVEAAVHSGLFDALGHLDFVKRYLASFFGPADYAAAPELYEPILRALVDNGMALEVNTSGLRQAPRETYPPPAVVARFHALGGRHITAGSDAHLPESFAFGLAEGYEAIARAGFESIAFRRGGGSVSIRLPDLVHTR
jgi:histidinol-phosphatase (PHP family)